MITKFRDGKGKELAISALKDFIIDLRKRYEVYLLLDNPMSAYLDPKSMMKNRLSYFFGDTFSVSSEQLSLNEELKAAGIESGARVIDQIQHLCPDNNCRRYAPAGTPIYKDNSHMRPYFVIENASFMDIAWKK